MTSDVNSSEKIWLVKSSTRILGPFTLAEVTEHIKSKHISIIDEIRQPDGRWIYIRENRLFMDIVRNVRDAHDPHSEETMTQSIAHNTSFTRTDNIQMLDEKTPIPPASKVDITPPPLSNGLKDVTPPAGAPSRATTSSAAKSYGTASDYRVQGQLRQKSNFWRWVMMGTTVAAAVFISFNLLQKDKKKSVSYDELMKQAIRYKSLGLYEKSLQTYQRAIKIKEPDSDAQTQMAPVLISEDRQSLMGRRILEHALMQDGRSRADVVDAYLGIAVSYMLDGDLQQAEDTLQKAIGHEPYNLSALLNLAIIQQKKGNYIEAKKKFEAIYEKNPQSVLALYGRAISTVESSKAHFNANTLQTLIRDITVNVQKTGYLRQELLLLVIYAQSLLGDVDGVNQSVVYFLNQLPGQARNYTHPLQVEWRFSQWDYLQKYCAELYQKQTPNSQLKAMRAICFMEVNRDTEAEKLLQEALVEAPRDPYVLSTQAGYLVKVGRTPEATTILRMPELKVLSVKNFLVGDICLNAQDVSCVQNVYGQSYAQNIRTGKILHGLAWASLRKNDRKKAYEYVRLGLQSEPNYLPLLELRDQLESE